MSAFVPTHGVTQLRAVLSVPRPRQLQQHLAGPTRRIRIGAGEKHQSLPAAELSLTPERLLWFFLCHGLCHHHHPSCEGILRQDSLPLGRRRLLGHI